MKVSYNWLQSFFKRKLPAPVKLAEVLTMHSFETTVQNPKPKTQNPVLDVDVLPNRAADCLSHLGIAREVAAVTGQGTVPATQGQSLQVAGTVPLKVAVKAKDLCSRYCARVVTDVQVGPSPKWMQERLEACGVRAINNLVDVTNYVMLEIGQPMHAFDMDKVQGQSPEAPLGTVPEIAVRRAQRGETITTLDGEKRELDENILVIADAKKPIALAGVMGGANTEVNQQTTKVILESANFNPQIIRRTSQKFNCRTESSMRFEYGLDANLASQAIDRAAFLTQEIAGGKVAQGIIDIYPKKVRPKKIKLEVEKVKRLLGVDISVREIKRILKGVSFDIVERHNLLEVTVPTWRLDISIPEDLIEEISRLYGFQKILSQLPATSLIPAEPNTALIYQNKIRDILVGLGFTEVYNYSFISQQQLQGIRAVVALELENPVSQEQKYLRPSLLPNLLKNVKDNLRFFDEIRLFEIGKIFQPAEETKKLGLIFSLKEKHKEAREFYRLKGVTDSLLNKLGLSDIWYDDQMSDVRCQISDIFHPSRRAEIKVGEDLVGMIGEINPEILRQLAIKCRVAAFEINLEKLTQLATEERIYQPPSKYPAVVRDIAVLVEPGTKVVEVLNLINAAGGKLVRDVDLFDMYEGEEIQEGKKNLAFHIIYQADDRTLTDKEVDKIHAKIVLTLEKEKGWEVRR